MRTRRGFTLVEGLIALVIGGMVIGGTMMVYVQGTRSFVKTTEHTTFRTEAMLLLERITRELDEMIVTDFLLPDGTAHLTRPFTLVDAYPLPSGADDGATVEAGIGIRFFKFHRVDMVDAGATLAEGTPKMIARLVEYKSVPIDEDKPELGVNLFRNERKINRVPLRFVLFRKVPKVVSDMQIRGSPHAIVRIDVVPEGGMWNKMDQAVIDNLASQDRLVSRTHHLVGYESMYTAVLSNALEKMRPDNEGDPPKNIDDVLNPVEKGVYQDAYQVTSPQLLAILENTDRPTSTFEMPEDSFYILEEELHDKVNGDFFFEAAKGKGP